MKIEARIFLLITLFCWLAAAAYGAWTDANDGGIEMAGFVALILSGGLLGICGSFFWFISRRIDPRPEDRSDAEIAEAAGELGFFSPHSYWPLGIAGGAALTGFGLAFVQIWLVILGIFVVLFNVGGLLFEYYIGGRRPAPHPSAQRH
jgi:hypothetical protein